MLLIALVLGGGATASLLIHVWFNHQQRRLTDEIDRKVRSEVHEKLARDRELTGELAHKVLDPNEDLSDSVSVWQRARTNLCSLSSVNGSGRRDYEWDNRDLDRWRKEECARLSRKDIGRMRVRWIFSMVAVLAGTAVASGGLYAARAAESGPSYDTEGFSDDWTIIAPTMNDTNSLEEN